MRRLHVPETQLKNKWKVRRQVPMEARLSRAQTSSCALSTGALYRVYPDIPVKCMLKQQVAEFLGYKSLTELRPEPSCAKNSGIGTVSLAVSKLCVCHVPYLHNSFVWKEDELKSRRHSSSEDALSKRVHRQEAPPCL